MSPRVVSAAEWLAALAHLHARNTTFAAVSRAPISKVEPFRQRMGWTFPWYSSQGSDFNYDFHVTHDESVAPIQYSFRTEQELTDMGEPLTPLGRQDETVKMRHHDNYP